MASFIARQFVPMQSR